MQSEENIPQESIVAFFEADREKLRSVVEEIDTYLADFKILLKKTVRCDADYSLSSLKYVELLLMHLKPKASEDADLLIESALYIGETARGVYHTEWDIANSQEIGSKTFGQPFLKTSLPDKDFYPFLEIKNFISHPSIGYFKAQIEANT